MISNQTINEITQKISALLPDSIKVVQNDIEHNIRAVVESTFSKMNLVSREEFDVQSALLARSLEKLQQLEEQITELEKK
ncbi:MAG: accessory factor UbiK family protein [Gammaproteobacteria bacterium]|nr:accessory factor UbiK family protein [Gammaproteobacteria bacterium]MCW9005503.1 accessory factor UbiK family protein [Gammaproteobacteria bacterium]MCW9057019.1 accessory factor UbiK family protein [Gammaproteobacteria bacterium]